MTSARKCAVSDCGNPARCLGWCNSHYNRYRRHGDPLGGGTSVGDPLRFIHEVAVSFQGDGCLIWPFSTTRGYGKIWVEGKLKRASRYVCELVHGDPPSPTHEAAHNCGKGDLGCIHPQHLEWKTSSENHADKIEHGTANRGDRHGLSKLTEAQVKEILRLKSTKSQRTLAEEFGVSRSNISQIHLGTAWSWLHDRNV